MLSYPPGNMIKINISSEDENVFDKAAAWVKAALRKNNNFQIKDNVYRPIRMHLYIK